MKRKERFGWRLFSCLCLFFVLGAIPKMAAAQPAVRELKIKAAVSPVFKYDPNWEEDIKERILFANKIFEPGFQIHFSLLKTIPWEPEDETRETDLLMEELRSFIPQGPDEIVIGFHHMSRPFEQRAVVDNDTVGSAQFFKGFVVIRDPFFKFTREQKDVVFAHEMVHLFGGVHVPDKNAVMHPTVPRRPSLVLDQDNSEIIKATRLVDFHKGLDSLSEEVIEKLIRAYEKLIRLNPHSDFYYQLGNFYKQLGQEVKAVGVWEEAVRYQYDNPNIHGALGYYYYQTQNFSRTIQELGSAVAHYILPSQKKQKALTLNMLGVAYFEKGNPEQAIFSWLQGLTADPENKILQGNLASAYLETGNVDRAISEYEKLVAKDMKDPTTISNLGAAYMRKGDLEKAIEFFEKAATLLSVQSKKAKFEGTKTSLIGHIPEHMIRSNLGGAYLQVQKYDQALEQLLKAKELGLDDYDLHRNLAVAYTHLKDYDPATKEIEAALKIKKDDPYLYSFLGQIYSDTGREEEAMKAIEDGLRYAKGDLAAVFRRNKAMLFARKNEFNKAIAELKTALNLNWDDPDGHAQLGMLYLQRGEIENAKRSFQTAIRIQPGHSLAQTGMDSLKGRV